MATTVSAESALVARVQELTATLEQVSDPLARGVGEDLAAAVVQLYGEGLERIFAALEEEASVDEVRERLVEDGVVASLMLIHGLYPVSLEQRVHDALEEVRPYMESHGGNVELLGVEDGIARLRLVGSCDSCPSSAATMELAIEEALQQAAPDLAGLDVEGVVASDATKRPAAPPPDSAAWVELEGTDAIERGMLVTAGENLIVANIAGTLLAYRDHCTGCGARLNDGLLMGGTLTCTGCSRGWDLPRAGRCRESEEKSLQLEPIPLLRRGGSVKVALAA